MLGRVAPRLSTTERQALAAGTVWIDGDLFAGCRDLRRLAALPYPGLSAAETAFLAGPVEEVCRMVDDWELQRIGELPPAAWAFLKAHRFFGLTLPVEYGGLGMSALGASTVFGKVASRSMALSAIVLIPNSVGPGELLLEHGTPEQRRELLPRLARGEEIPCFALTEPEAGSDAASLTSRGTVYRGPDGAPWLRLDFEKRYITLAPVATLIGLAVRLEDPDGLLGRGTAPGITVVLLSAATPGVEIGDRHDPLGVPFPNGPIRGRGVEVPASAIVGGPARAGDGWQMLMEALSAGRSISLPAQAAGGAKAVARTVTAYAGVRRQFGRPIGAFEGVEERMARIAGLTYAMEATRVLVCGAVDAGERPAVVSALAKLQQTELVRQVATDAMDVLGGAAISRGPRNPLGDAWRGVPIGITVEGANILTRTLIAFGQGVVRSHPWARRELAAAEAESATRFAAAAAGHLGSFLANGVRSLWLGLTGGRFVRAPVGGPGARYWRRLRRAAVRFAFWTDLALFTNGSGLKARGKISGRFADELAAMLRLVAVLRRFEAEGRHEQDAALMRWAAEHALAEVQAAHEGIVANLLPGALGRLARGPVLALTRLRPLGRPPSDRLGAAVAAAVAAPGAARDRLTAGTFLSDDPEDARTRLERAFGLAAEAEPLRARLRAAVRDGALPRESQDDPEAGLAAGILSAEEAERLARARAAAREAIRVDAFPAVAGRPETPARGSRDTAPAPEGR